MNVRRISAAGIAALAVGGLTGGTMGSGEHLGWVPDAVTVGEGDGRAVLTIERDMCATGRLRVAWWAPNDVDADTAGPADFAQARGTHRFDRCEVVEDDDGKRRAAVTIPIVDDDEAEEDEHFSVGLGVEHVSTNDENPLPDGGAREATVVIQDDDGPTTEPPPSPPDRPTETTPTTPTTPVVTEPLPPAPPAPAPAPTVQRSSSKQPAPVRCVSRRRFSITLGRRYASAKAALAGAPLPIARKRGRLVVSVDLVGRPKGRFDVVVTGRTRAGRPHTETRRYRTCTPRKR